MNAIKNPFRFLFLAGFILNRRRVICQVNSGASGSYLKTYYTTTGPKHYASVIVSDADVTALGSAHIDSFSPNSPPYFHLNEHIPRSSGAVVVSPSQIESLGVLDQNCTVNFQLYMGDVGKEYSGSSYWNMGADSGCLLHSSNPEDCGGIGLLFQSSAELSAVQLNVGDSLIRNTNILPSLLNEWISVSISLVTYNASSDSRAVFVHLFGHPVFVKAFPWHKSDLHSQIEQLPENEWSNRMTFFARNCNEYGCSNEHIVQNLNFRCEVTSPSTSPTVSMMSTKLFVLESDLSSYMKAPPLPTKVFLAYSFASCILLFVIGIALRKVITNAVKQQKEVLETFRTLLHVSDDMNQENGVLML